MSFRPSENHWRAANFRERVTLKQLQEVLLNEPALAFRNGEGCTWAHQRIGPGVYEIWLEVRK